MDPDPLSCILLSIGTLLNEAPITFNVPTVGSIIALLCACCFLCMSAFVSGSEIAFFSLTSQQIEDVESREGNTNLKKLFHIPEKLLATILITNNLVNVAIVIFCNFALSQMLDITNATLDFIIQSVLLTFLILLFGEILPKLYATTSNLKFITFAAPGLVFLSKIFSPLSRILVKSSVIVNRMVAVHSDDLSTDDLSKALEMTHVKGEDDKELLEGILKFGGTTVTEIMKPRIDIVDIDYKSDFDKVINTVISSGYSRLPVFEDNPDNIKGLLYSKDLLPYIGKKGKEFKWQDLLREAYYVPETRMIDDLLEDFRTKKIHMAIVVDEFGGTQGIVTLEDVLEEIVGDINDEYDTEEKFYQKIGENTYVFEGKTLMNDFFKVTEIDEADFGDITEEVETLAGLLLEVKGDFPKANEPIKYGNCIFTVLKLDKHRITSVKVKIVPEKKETES